MYVGNRLLQSVRTGCNRYDGPTALTEAACCMVSDKSGLMSTDDKASVLILPVTIIVVTWIATLSWTDLISVPLNAVTWEHAFFRVYTRKNATDLLQPVGVNSLIRVCYHSCIRLFRTDGIRLEKKEERSIEKHIARRFTATCKHTYHQNQIFDQHLLEAGMSVLPQQMENLLIELPCCARLKGFPIRQSQNLTLGKYKL